MRNLIRNYEECNKVQSNSNNRGFSLVEILVTIIILVLLVAVTTFRLSTTKYADVERCSENIEKKMSQLRLSVMSSKTQEYLIIYQADDDNYYMAISDDKDKLCTASDGEKIGNSKIHITGTTSSGVTKVSHTDNGRIVISFHRSSGAFISVGVNLYQTIEIVTEGVKFRIYLVKETGKHYSKQIY